MRTLLANHSFHLSFPFCSDVLGIYACGNIPCFISRVVHWFLFRVFNLSYVASQMFVMGIISNKKVVIPHAKSLRQKKVAPHTLTIFVWAPKGLISLQKSRPMIIIVWAPKGLISLQKIRPMRPWPQKVALSFEEKEGRVGIYPFSVTTLCFYIHKT